MPNQLAGETSPYLLQHADNPVDWYPWGPEALDRAQADSRPIFLSIGYSACHWCHVMEHESFEDEQISRLLNDNFVCIKVDREERPDLDHIYMNAVQLMTGRGGWPMSVFLTPQRLPFYGGTYWPPHSRMGMPGFDQVLTAVIDAWRNRREDLDQQASQLKEHLDSIGQQPPGDGQVGVEMLRAAEARLEQVFDFAHGGFGQAPKFPHPMDLQLLLRIWHRWPREGVLEMVRLNLDKMAQGGIYDHLAGGFARYSVDERWLVPHFEKMLYDNALLAGAYLNGYLATGDTRYRCVARETLDYVLTYLTDPQGGFHSTEDADSEGEEGKFYVWTPAEVMQLLGQEIGPRFCYVYDVSEAGNFEGRSILNLPKTLEQCAAIKGWDADQLRTEMAQSRKQLLTVRDQRVRPGKDDKVLVSWNGLMIDCLARATRILHEPKYLSAAAQAAEFILDHMRLDDGRLLHSWRLGVAKFDAYLDDYTCLGNSLVSIYESTFEERWIDEVLGLADIVMHRFRDRERGGFFFTADDHEPLITRPKDLHDSSVPSGNAMAATLLLRLGKLCGRADYLDAARQTIQAAAAIMQQSPTAVGQMLIALDMQLGPMPEIVVVGDRHEPDTASVLNDLAQRYVPNYVIACRTQPEAGDSTALAPIFAGKPSLEKAPTVYSCEDFSCQAPVCGKEAVLALWQQLASPNPDTVQ